MCVGGLFGGGRKPAPPPQRQAPAPTMQAAAPPPEMVAPETITDDKEDKDLLSTKEKKAKEELMIQQGVATFGAINPSSLPNTPSGGVNAP